MALAVAFCALAALAASFDYFPGDVQLAQAVQDIDSRTFAYVLDYTEDVGDLPGAIAVWAVATAVFSLVGGRWTGLLTAATMLGRPVNTLVKEIVARPRPSLSLVEAAWQPDSYSFPSGHMSGALVLYGFIYYLASVYVPDIRLRLCVQAACLWIIAVTGLERVYVGHHWPSDVLGGFLFGLLLLLPLIAAERVVRLGRGGVRSQA